VRDECSNVKIVTSNSMDLKLHVIVADKARPKDPPKTETLTIPASVFLEQRVTQVTHNNKLELVLVTSGADDMKKGEYLVMPSPIDPKKGGFFTVEFSVQYHTNFGEIVFIVGNIPEIGSWKEGLAKRMEWTDGGLWKLQVTFPSASIPIEYKYVMLNTFTKQLRWEVSANHVMAAIPPEGKQKDSWEVFSS